jgi:hypothetical protein
VRLPEESFDFLGYSIGRFYGKDGVPYMSAAHDMSGLGSTRSVRW